MVIDFSQPIVGLDRKPVMEPEFDLRDPSVRDEDKSWRALTLGSVCVTALLRQRDSDVKLTGAQKIDRLRLADSLHEAQDADVSVADLALLQSLVGETFSTLVAGRALHLLEGKQP